jgi:hypothetical protein
MEKNKKEMLRDQTAAPRPREMSRAAPCHFARAFCDFSKSE